MTSRSLNLAPQARQQLAAVAGLRWRVFVNSLRTFRGRMELASRIFISLAFLAGGIGGAVGLGGAAWFLILHGNAEWLGTLLWPVFLFWQLFPLMATAFTQNVESSSLLRFPLSYRSYFLIRLAYGSLDPATAVASLWLLGIDIGIGSRPAAHAPLGHHRAPDLCAGEHRPGAHAVCLAGALAGPAADARNHGDSFLSLYSEFSADRTVDCCRTNIAPYPESRVLGQKLSNAQRPLPPGLAAAAIAGRDTGQARQQRSPFLLLGVYGIAFLWLLNFRLRAEYRGENLSESARRKAVPSGLPALRPGWNLPGLPGPGRCRLRKRIALSQSQRADALHSDRAPVHAGGLSKFRQERRSVGACCRNSPSPWAPPTHCCLLTNLSYNNFGADGGGTQFFFASPVRFRQIMMGKNLAHASRIRVGSCTGVAGNLFALPVAIAGRNHGHAGGHSVCRSHRPGRREPVLDLFSHPNRSRCVWPAKGLSDHRAGELCGSWRSVRRGSPDALAFPNV